MNKLFNRICVDYHLGMVLFILIPLSSYSFMYKWYIVLSIHLLKIPKIFSFIFDFYVPMWLFIYFYFFFSYPLYFNIYIYILYTVMMLSSKRNWFKWTWQKYINYYIFIVPGVLALYLFDISQSFLTRIIRKLYYIHHHITSGFGITWWDWL